MWNFSSQDGVCLNKNHNGLLIVTEENLSKLIKTDPISNVYDVEHTPFARGKFAAVRKCTHKSSGIAYAAKFIRKRRRASDQRQDILHEIAILHLAGKSERIVTLHEVYETSTEMALVLELAAGGELQQILDTEEGLPEVEAVRLMNQILEAVSFLHSRNIAHLDLKPQNILLTGSFPESDMKLCDFGISRVINPGVEVREIMGTPDYVAPEILSFEPISLSTDIWSIGILAYVLLSGYSPFSGDTKQETFCNISQCNLTFPEELFEGISETAKDFIRATLVTEPSQRMTTSQCLAHPWLNKPSSKVKMEPLLLTSSESIIENRDTPKEEENHKSHSSKDSGPNSEEKCPEIWIENDDELPAYKRPRSSSEVGLSSSFTAGKNIKCGSCLAQCCHTDSSAAEFSHISRNHHSIPNSPVEILVDRGIKC